MPIVLLSAFVLIVNSSHNSMNDDSWKQEISSVEKQYGLQSLQCGELQAFSYPENIDHTSGVMNCIAVQGKTMHNYLIEWSSKNNQNFKITRMYEQDESSWKEVQNPGGNQ